MELIFVYGTLRQGGVRAIPTLFPTAEFVGFGTVRGWLYDFGAYPGLIVDSAGRNIAGEVYRVDAAAVREMDDIERYTEGDAESFYFRRPYPIHLRDGNIVMAGLYECNPKHYDCSTPMNSTDWIAHANAKGELPEESWPDGAPIKK